MRTVLLTIMTLLLLGFCPLSQSFGQTQLTTTPLASPKAWVGQRVGLTDVTVKYHRPAVNDRTIWGELVPYNTVWRAGANDNTIIQFSDDVAIEGQHLSAGVYGLHMEVRESDATLILSHNSTSWGSYTYNPAEDALRVDIPSKKAGFFQEQLAFRFEDVSTESAVCILHWGDRMFPFSISSNVHEAVLANFRNELRSKAGWSWQGYNEAAGYCLNNKVNEQEGLAWATRSVFMNPNPNNMVLKARLTAAADGKEGDEAKAVTLKTLDQDLEKMNVTWKEYNGAAVYAIRQESWDYAGKWIDQSIAMSENMTNLMNKVKLLENKGETAKSEKLKKAAIEKGSNAELNQYAYNLMWAGKAKEAVAIFEANAEKHPDDPNVWDSLGEGYINAGEKDKAIHALK
ncbi:MAG: DUF2911 domain-containing protein, partial [Phaeodactylibacter sp.]|nr:DUF2911 domain-containing protein [Phaeodactylibacter sp.]